MNGELAFSHAKMPGVLDILTDFPIYLHEFHGMS
jgi:hypothetical protein